MDRSVYINGKFFPEAEAKISVFDRGFLFADGVYEVTTVLDGKLVDWDGHMERLKQSLNKVSMTLPVKAEELNTIHLDLIKRNNISEGLVYMQVSRGIADRDFIIPSSTVESLVMFTQKLDLLDSARLNRGLRVITVPDIRWGRCDIKTVQLMASSLIKTDAKNKGYDDAWLVKDGYITEGTSSNAFIISSEKKLITRCLGSEILAGVTRSAILEAATALGLIIEERPFSVEEAQLAAEAFITSSTSFITSVVEINGRIIGNHEIESITKELRRLYLKNIQK